jgi:formiminotetrahydrofolate cyclodeaminase
MKLAEMTVTQFADVLASDAPAPGGGSTAALAGALGAALTAMVCRLTEGRKKYEEFEAHVLEVKEKATALQAKFIDVMDRDTEAFMVISNAYGMPKATDEEKAARSAAIQAGLVKSTETPMEMMELSAETIALTESLLGKFNTASASDLGVGALTLRTAVQGAWLNVLINIGSLKDKELAENYRAKGQALVDQVVAAADRIYETVLTLV